MVETEEIAEMGICCLIADSCSAVIETLADYYDYFVVGRCFYLLLRSEEVRWREEKLCEEKKSGEEK